MNQQPSRVKRILLMLTVVVLVVACVTFVFDLATKPKRPLPPPLPGADKGRPSLDDPTIRISVTNHEGKVVPAAKVNASWTFEDGSRGGRVFMTGSDGMADIPRSDKKYSYFEARIEPRNEPMVIRTLGRRSSRKELEIPEVYEIKLPRGKIIGGIVKNDFGEPVRTAKVYVYASVNSPKLESGETDFEYQVSRRGNVPTNKEGRWEMKGVPENYDSIQIEYSHSTHQPLGRNDGRGISKAKFTELNNRVHTVSMKKGIMLTGTVVDVEGNPISNALVTEGIDYSYRTGAAYSARTNEQGEFKYANAREVKSVLSVMHMDFAPLQMEIKIQKRMEPFQIELSKGKRLEVQLVNSADKPLRGVRVTPGEWFLNNFNNQKLRMLFDKNKDKFTTNEKGVFVWENAPEGDFRMNFYLENYMNRNDQFSAREEPYKINLSKQKRIIVKAVDASSGNAISKFECSFGEQYNSGGGRVQHSWWGMRQGSGGEYVHTINRNIQNKFAFRVKASGYKPAISDALDINEIDSDTKEITVKLIEGFGPKGVIVTAEGEPANQANIAAYTPDNNSYVSVRNGNLNRNSRTNNTKSDAKGKFELEPIEDDYGLIVTHETGYANIRDKDFEKTSGEIVLRPWAKVSGVLLEHGKPVGNRQVAAHLQQRHVQGAPRFYTQNQTETDSEGKFTFDSLMGEVTMNFGQRFQIRNDNYSTSGDSQELQLEIKSGEEKEITLGGKGRPVIGKVIIPEGRNIMPNFYYATQEASAEERNAQAFGGLVNLIQQSTGVDLGEVAQPKQIFRRRYAFSLEEDGSFRMEEVVPGEYQIHINLHERGGNGSWNFIGNASHKFTLPEMEEEISTDPLDIGEIQLQVRNRGNRF